MNQMTPAAYFDILNQAQKAYSKQLDPVCKEWGLTRNELDVMLFLYNNPESDRAADIVARRGIAKSHVSLSVSTLEEKGLLVRQYSETDRRTAHLKLTEQGAMISAQGRQRQREYFNRIHEGVDVETMKKQTLKILENIEKINSDSIHL